MTSTPTGALPSDETLALAVDGAARHLNGAIAAAAQAGLRVELETLEIDAMNRPGGAIMVRAIVIRVIRQ